MLGQWAVSSRKVLGVGLSGDAGSDTDKSKKALDVLPYTCHIDMAI